MSEDFNKDFSIEDLKREEFIPYDEKRGGEKWKKVYEIAKKLYLENASDWSELNDELESREYSEDFVKKVKKMAEEDNETFVKSLKNMAEIWFRCNTCKESLPGFGDNDNWLGEEEYKCKHWCNKCFPRIRKWWIKKQREKDKEYAKLREERNKKYVWVDGKHGGRFPVLRETYEKEERKKSKDKHPTKLNKWVN
jgi:hypothetical protein